MPAQGRTRSQPIRHSLPIPRTLGKNTLAAVASFALAVGGRAAQACRFELTPTRDAAGSVDIYEDRSLSQTCDGGTDQYADFTGHDADFFVDDFHTCRNEAAPAR